MALAIVALPALAQDKKETETTKGFVVVGEQTGTNLDQSSKLRQYESIPTNPTIYDGLFSTEGAAGYWMKLRAYNVGAEDQNTSMEGGKYNEFKWTLVWDQNPNYYSNTARTLYEETSPGVFRLPNKLRSDLQAVYWTPGAGAIAVPANDGRSVALGAELGFYTLAAPNAGLNNYYPMENIDLKYLRRTGKAGFEYMGIENWLFSLDYTQERRTGNQATSIFDGTSILEVAAPIQYKTQNLAFSAEYAKKSWFLKGTLNFSKFEDAVDRLYVDNPMRLTNDPAQLAGVYRQQQAAVFGMPTQPDNKANSINLVGGVTLPAHHRLVFTYTEGEMSMDTSLMPGSTIPYYADQTGGLTSISTKLDNTMITARFTGDPISMFGYSLDYRKWDLKDKTADYTFSPIGRGDSTAPSATTTFEHEDQTRSKDTLKAEVHVSPFGHWRFGLGAGQEKSKNEIRTVREVKDDTLTLKVDANYQLFAFHGSYTDLKRTPTYEDGLIRFDWNAGTPTNPYNANVEGNETDTAKRDSKLIAAVLSYNPTETLTMDLSLNSIDNKFPDSPVHGLQSSKSSNYGVDVNWAPSERFSLLFAYVYEDFKYTMDSQYLGANVATASNLDRWGNNVEDKVDTFKVGLTWRISSKMDLNSDYDYSKGRSDSAYTTTGSYIAGLGGSYQAQGYLFDPKATGANIPYGYTIADAGAYLVQPEVVNKTTIWKTRLNYHLKKNLAISFMYWMQKYDRADWARDNMQPYMYSVDPGANKSLFLGARIPSYDANVYRASITYTF
jgi:MtrB/PioB family decaheme-associated outer membrane protein